MRRKLNPRQQRAAELFVNPESKTFGNKTQSYIAAGYACRGKTATQQACKLFTNPNICQYISNYQKNNIEIAAKRAVTQSLTKDYAIERFIQLYERCWTDHDNTNCKSLLQTLWQHLGMLDNKLTIDFGEARELEEIHRESVRRLAAIVLSKGVMTGEQLTALPPAVEAQFEASSGDSSHNNDGGPATNDQASAATVMSDEALDYRTEPAMSNPESQSSDNNADSSE